MRRKASALLLLGFFLASSLAGALPVLCEASQVSPALDWQKDYSGYGISWVSQAPSGGFAFYIPGTQVWDGRIVTYGYLNKISASGTMDWSVKFNTPFPEKIQTTNDGYVYTSRGNSSLKNGPVTITKLDLNGAQQWSKTLPDYLDGSVLFTPTADGGYALANKNYTGYVNNNPCNEFVIEKTDVHCNLVWTKTLPELNSDYSMKSFMQTSDGGYAIAGAFTNSTTVDGSDICLIKLDSLGNLQWVKTFGGANDDSAEAMVETGDGDYVLACNTASFGAGCTDALLIRTDSSGNLKWAHTYGGSGKTMVLRGQTDFQGKSISDASFSSMNPGSADDCVGCLIQTQDGGFAFAGTTGWNDVSYTFMWLVKTDANGNEEWSETFGNFETAYVYAMRLSWGLSSFIQAADGSFLLGGSSMGSSYWDIEGFLVKTKPDIASSVTSQPIPLSSMSLPVITINSDGSVTPSDAPITHSGNQYDLTADVNGSIIVRATDIVLNGQGHLISGNGTVGNLFVQISGVGVAVSGTENVKLENLKIQHFKVAVMLSDSYGAIVSDNMLTLDRQGIVGHRTQQAVISGNTIRGINQEGIYLSLCLNSKIANNKLVNGVHIENSSGNVLCDNEFGGSDIVMYYSQNTLLSGNEFSDSWNTLQIHDSQELTAAANNFKDCVMPIATSGTSGILVYMNNFINYTYPPEIHSDTDSSGNPVYRVEVWDNGQVGNYWSNYTQTFPHAKEVGSSGTWDTPYELCPKNVDNHPLVSPVSSESMRALSQSLVSQYKPSENADATNAILLILHSPITLVVIALVVAAIIALLLLKFKAAKRKKLVESGSGGI